jgi:tRNA (guanine37-N1)-methyltransferase
MKIQIITLFPAMFAGAFDHSMLLKAQKQGQLSLEFVNLRDFGLGPRQQVDDTPYGGGDGMLLKVEPLAAAIRFAKSQLLSSKSLVILLSPGGERLRQPRVQTLAKATDLIIICGRYEGVDERVMSLVDLELSVGDYVLTGGEIPAMVLVDSVVRLIPGVLGGENSAEIESFSDGESLEFPQYTRPEEWEGHKVPEVLLSGHHGEITKWRNEQAELKTRRRQRQG